MNTQSLDGNLTGVKLGAKKILVAAGTQTFAGVDLQNFIGELKAIIATEGDNGDGGASITYSFLDSADNTTFATYAGAPTPVTVTHASATSAVSLDTRATRRYVQLKALTASTTATFTVGAVAVGVKRHS